jgi:hypothetical protein
MLADMAEEGEEEASDLDGERPQEDDEMVS